MRSRRTWCLVVGTIGAIAAVGLTVTVAANGALTGSEWRPVEIAGKSVPAETPLFIRFGADGTVVGHGGCNRMIGSYTIDKATLRIGPLTTTRKGCPVDIMALEHAFTKALEATQFFLRQETKLSFKNGHGATTLRLAQTDWD